MARSRRALLATLSAVIAGCGSRTGSPTPTSTSTATTPSPTDSPIQTQTESPTKTPDHSPQRVAIDDDRVRWRIDFPSDRLAELTATPDTLYVGSGGEPVPTPTAGEEAEPGYLTTVSVPDGELSSHRSLAAPITDGPFLHEGNVYFCVGYSSGYDGRDQRVVRHDADGKRWESPERDAWLSVYGFDSDTAYLGTSDDALAGEGETAFSVSVETGSEEWAVEAGDAYGGRVAGDTLYADFAGVAIASLATADGSAQWRRQVEPLHGYGQTFPTAAGNLFAAVGADGSYGIAGIDAADGTKTWTHGLELNDPLVVNSATGVNEMVIATEFGGLLFAREGATGEARWELSFEDRVTAPLVGDGTLYCAVRDGPIVAVDAENGEELWRVSDGDGYARLSLVRETLLSLRSGEMNTVVSARRTSDGGLQWRKNLGGRLSGFERVGDRLFVATGSQSVYGISL